MPKHPIALLDAVADDTGVGLVKVVAVVADQRFMGAFDGMGWGEVQAVERVDGVNCDIAGDGFCDTPADYLNYRWNCNNQGLSNVTQTDPLGEKLKSDGSLIMSYSSDVCSYRFSEEQIAAMQEGPLWTLP